MGGGQRGGGGRQRLSRFERKGGRWVVLSRGLVDSRELVGSRDRWWWAPMPLLAFQARKGEAGGFEQRAGGQQRGGKQQRWWRAPTPLLAFRARRGKAGSFEQRAILRIERGSGRGREASPFRVARRLSMGCDGSVSFISYGT